MVQPLPLIMAASILLRVVGGHEFPRAISHSLDLHAGNPFFIIPYWVGFGKTPLKAYLVILTGPIFILWRIWLSLVIRFGTKSILWVRTAHKG